LKEKSPKDFAFYAGKAGTGINPRWD